MTGFNYRILAVDSQAESRLILKRILYEEGYEFDLETSPKKAYANVLKQHYDLIISECLVLGDQMSGLDLLQKIRENNSNVPFIVIADKTSVETSVKAINYGVAGYLVKPIAVKETKEIIKQAIRQYKSRYLKSELVNYRMDNTYSAVIASSEQAILKLLDTVDNLIELVYPSDYGSFPDLKMALYEGLSNAIEHGNKNKSENNVYFKIELQMDRIMVHIKDEGDGFNSVLIQNKNELKRVNRGLNLINHLMDEVSFNIKGNELNLLKLINR